jgi:signal transduction histidine kinase
MRHMWITLVDADGVVVFGGRQAAGATVSRRELRQGVPLKVEGEVVGWLLYDAFRDPWGPGPPEGDFLERVKQAIVFGALGAMAMALLLGVLLARTLTRPIRELTAATRLVAQGDLGRQVTVRSKDELGQLTASFNRMSRDLARTNKLRRQMTADIAHDLRTPLSVILGYTEALSDGKLQGTPEMYEVLYSEAQHLRYLIEDLRILSLADAGELPLTRQRIAPRVLLERTAVAHGVRAEQRDISLHVDAPADLPAVEVDPDRMAQVLGNLVANAMRYTPAGGRIVLAAESDANAVTLHVQDDGAGIAPDDLPYVFERFYRGDKSRQQLDGESGLGLAIVKSLVEAHGGTVSAESTLGEGTTFTITIPRCV